MSKESMTAQLKKLYEDRNINIPNSFNVMMSPEVIDCDEEERTLTIAFQPQEWMANPLHNLHGGILSTAADICMGSLCYYLAGNKMCVTGNLNVNFLRAGRMGSRLFAKAKAGFCGKSVMHFTCELWMEDCPEKLVCTATGVFVNVSHSLRV